ncbi:MAG TPA: response regulator transcription factor [Mycobacteriales bacterium]|nr:response regulator transcription factor [Mycobacteriales bacterium]
MTDVRVVLVDDQEMVRAGFRLILESEPGLQVVGVAGNGAAGVSVARELRPDVVLMDIEMPGMDGITATGVLAAEGMTVVMLTTFERDDYILEAVRAGASGFLLKNAPPEELVAAVRVAAEGDALLSPRVTRRVLDRLAAEAPTSSAARVRLGELTEREVGVLRLVALGRSNREIAGELFLGEATVKTHVSNMLAKLHLRDRVQAVVFAYESGLVRATGRDPSLQ